MTFAPDTRGADRPRNYIIPFIAATRIRLALFGTAAAITIGALIAEGTPIAMLVVGFIAGGILGAAAMWLDHSTEREDAYNRGWQDRDRLENPRPGDLFVQYQQYGEPDNPLDFSRFPVDPGVVATEAVAAEAVAPDLEAAARTEWDEQIKETP